MVGNILILETAFLWSFLGIVTKMVTYHGMTVTAVISLVAMLTLRVCNRGSAIRWNRQILLTALATAGQTICFFLANKYTTVANTIVLQFIPESASQRIIPYRLSTSILFSPCGM